MQRTYSESSETSQSSVTRRQLLQEIQKSNIQTDIFWRNFLAALQIIPILIFLAACMYMDLAPVSILGVRLGSKVVHFVPYVSIGMQLLCIMFVLFNNYKTHLYSLYAVAVTVQCTILGCVVYVLITNRMEHEAQLNYIICLVSLIISVVLMTFGYFGERFSYRQR